MVALFVTLVIVGLILLDVVASRLSVEFHLSRTYGEAGFSSSKKNAIPPLQDSVGATVSKGMFQHRGHMWAFWEPDGNIRTGIDDLIHRVIGRIDEVRPPEVGESLTQGAKAVMIRQGDRVMYLLSPATGIVTAVNTEVLANPSLIKVSPYDNGWIFELSPSNVEHDLHHLKISDSADEWILKEESRIRRFLNSRIRTAERNAPEENRSQMTGILENLGEETWILFKDQFIYQQEWRT